MLILQGVVDSGQHWAGVWAKEDPLIATMLGVEIHAGSINVCVSTAGQPDLAACNHPFFSLHTDEAVKPADIRRTGFLLVRDCTVNGDAAYMLRTEQPGKAYDGPGNVVPTRLPQPNIMFEIVAAYLPWVKYGVEVTLEFDPSPEALKRLRVP